MLLENSGLGTPTHTPWEGNGSLVTPWEYGSEKQIQIKHAKSLKC